MKVIEVRDDKLIQTVQVWWVSECVRGKFVLLRLALGETKHLDFDLLGGKEICWTDW